MDRKAKGIVICVSKLQSSKTNNPIIVKEGGKLIFFSNEQPLKTEFLIEFKDEGDSKSNSSNELQSLNALLPIEITVEGIKTFFKEMQPSNELSPIEITDEKVTYLSDKHPLKA